LDCRSRLDTTNRSSDTVRSSQESKPLADGFDVPEDGVHVAGHADAGQYCAAR